MEGIEGKVVVITGASSGLGEAAARHLSAQGAKVVLGARRVERLQAPADELKATGATAHAPGAASPSRPLPPTQQRRP